MALTINKASLASRVVRTAIGVRKFSPGQLSEKKGSGKLVEWVVSSLGRLAGFIFSGIGNFLSWSLSSLWSMVVSARNFIWNFNWNISDRALDQQIQQRWNSFGGLLGGLAGNAFGWFACGVLPGVSIFAFNRALGLYVLKEVGEEALDELAGNLAVVVQQTFRNLGAQAFSWAFKNWRSWMKQPGNPFAQALFGDRYAQVMKEWGKEGGPSWSFASALEEKIEQIPNQFVRDFVEEFLEEAWDSCVEAGFVVTNSVESFLAMQKQGAPLVLGPDRLIEVFPDREAESESIILAGPEELIKAQLPQALITHQLLENRDVGQWVGESVDENARRADPTLRLKIIFYNNAAPPFERKSSGQKITRVTVTIPDVRRSKLDFADIKAACGGQNGYLWGRFKANGKLTNGHYITVYAASKTEAEDRLKLFAALSDADLRTINVTEELKEGDRLINPGLYKETTRIYPSYCFVINRELVLAADRGQPVGKIRYKDKRFRLDLWPGQKPHDWDETIQEALRKAI